MEKYVWVVTSIILVAAVVMLRWYRDDYPTLGWVVNIAVILVAVIFYLRVRQVKKAANHDAEN